MSNDDTPPPTVLPPTPAVPVQKRRLNLLIERVRTLLAPETFNPKFSFLALLIVPLLVFGLHAAFNSGMIMARPLRLPITFWTKADLIARRAVLANASVSMPTGKASTRTSRSPTAKEKPRLCSPHSRVR